ncbi:hypothetical protein B0H17DRAFT_1140705 [Mycena rosella]|uniref:Uncharacterized protein n=1 Tax=Mycena rosella TaxID=1033263 RepID=A0AAD7GBK8_MYCRO|nr:hypothetical protein B0H17DRAFT_1140705 [Mycena rosella]
MLWGRSPEYGELRVKWSSSIMAQLRDYEAMFRTISIRQQSGLSGPLGNTPLVYLTRHANESDHDFARRLFVQLFIRDLTYYRTEAGTLAAGATITMNWDIAELAVKYQVCIINWPTLTPPLTVGWKAPSEFLAAVMPLLQERHQYQNDDDDVDDPDADSNSGEEMDAAEKAERKAARQAEKQAAKVADAAKAPEWSHIFFVDGWRARGDNDLPVELDPLAEALHCRMGGGWIEPGALKIKIPRPIA